MVWRLVFRGQKPKSKVNMLHGRDRYSRRGRTSDHHKWQERTGDAGGLTSKRCREQAGLPSAAHEPLEVLQEMEKTTIERQRGKETA